ncbi:unnamed protein product [Trichobilharzia regenti]|nr:unnamed protein product [Trichobilharzia regenti]
MNFSDDVISCLYEKLTDQVRTARTALWSAYQLFSCSEINDITSKLMNHMIDSVAKHLLPVKAMTNETTRSDELAQFNNKLLSSSSSSSEIDTFSSQILSKNPVDSVHKAYSSSAGNDNKWPMYTTPMSGQPIIWSATSLPFYQRSIIQGHTYHQEKVNNSNERLRNLISNQHIGGGRGGQVYANSTFMLSQSLPRSIQPTLLITTTPSLISGNNSSRYPCHPANSQHPHHLQQQPPQPPQQPHPHHYFQHQPTSSVGSVESCNNHDMLLSTGFYKNCM